VPFQEKLVALNFFPIIFPSEKKIKNTGISATRDINLWHFVKPLEKQVCCWCS